MSTEYVIRPVPLMTFDLPKSLMTYLFNDGQEVHLGSFIWYLEGPRQNIIVDAGSTPEYMVQGRRVEAIQTLEEGLNKLGLEASDIDIIIATHLHHDHIALARRFSNAKIIVQKAELEFARNPHPFFKARQPRNYTDLIEGLNFDVIEGDIKFDEGIELLLTPGHTPGGQSVAVKTSGGNSIITGWCCIQEDFDPPPEVKAKGFSFMLPGLHTNLMQAYESISRVIELSDIVVPVHEYCIINKTRIPEPQ